MIALRMNSPIINPKCFSLEYLFQTIRIETQHNAKITVQAVIITELEGVHSGRLRVLYHTIPDSAK